MSGRQRKVSKPMTQPITLLFQHLQNKHRIQVWLYEQTNTKIEGVLSGFDEYMNLVLDEVSESELLPSPLD